MSKRIRAEVTAHGCPGFYEADGWVRLLALVLTHRLGHLARSGKWED